jgi:hypothetical protein
LQQARENPKPTTTASTHLLKSIDSIVPSFEKTKQPIEKPVPSICKKQTNRTTPDTSTTHDFSRTAQSTKLAILHSTNLSQFSKNNQAAFGQHTRQHSINTRKADGRHTPHE